MSTTRQLVSFDELPTESKLRAILDKVGSLEALVEVTKGMDPGSDDGHYEAWLKLEKELQGSLRDHPHGGKEWSPSYYVDNGEVYNW